MDKNYYQDEDFTEFEEFEELEELSIELKLLIISGETWFKILFMSIF